MTSKQIKEKALQLGYISCAVIPVSAMDGCSERFDERCETYPQSKPFYENYRKMVNVPPDAKSIIVTIRRFNQYKTPEYVKNEIGRVYLVDGRLPYSKEHRYALEFETFLAANGIKKVNGNVLGRWAGAKSGLVKFGYNNFIYDEQHGSQIWVDTCVVENELEYDSVPENTCMSACSDDCLRCVKACPTKAFAGKFSMNMGRCIAHLMFREDITDEETLTQMGTWIYGCDMCQRVCPSNKDKFNESEEFPLLSDHEKYLNFETILEMDEDFYVRVLNPLMWYAGEEASWKWKRNVLRAMINSNEEKYHPYIKKYANHEDKRIAQMAKWGMEKLKIES